MNRVLFLWWKFRLLVFIMCRFSEILVCSGLRFGLKVFLVIEKFVICIGMIWFLFYMKSISGVFGGRIFSVLVLSCEVRFCSLFMFGFISDLSRVSCGVML